MIIRKTTGNDLQDIMGIHREAFGQDAEANLVADLLKDDSARPQLSLLAVEGGQAAGHILFTRVGVEGKPNPPAAILAPMAVLPATQGKGIGGKLILAGLQRLKESGVELVFVLGWPDFYPRFGFVPAGGLGYEAPYPIPAEHADAWMVRELRAGATAKARGKVSCADSLTRPELWVEQVP